MLFKKSIVERIIEESNGSPKRAMLEIEKHKSNPKCSANEFRQLSQLEALIRFASCKPYQK